MQLKQRKNAERNHVEVTAGKKGSVKRIWSWLKRYFIGPFLMGLGGFLETISSIVPMEGKIYIMIIGGVSVIGGAVLDIVFSREREKEIIALEEILNNREKKLAEDEIALTKEKEHSSKTACEIAMEALIHDLFIVHRSKGNPPPSGLRYRSNLMFFDNDEALKIWASINMSGEPDHSITFKKGTGCCGFAAKNKKTVWASLTGKSYAKYKLNHEQKSLTKQLKAVVSVPVFDDDHVVAVFNVDTTVSLSESLFRSTEVRKQIERVANTMSEIIDRFDDRIWNSFKVNS